MKIYQPLLTLVTYGFFTHLVSVSESDPIATIGFAMGYLVRLGHGGAMARDGQPNSVLLVLKERMKETWGWILRILK